LGVLATAPGLSASFARRTPVRIRCSHVASPGILPHLTLKQQRIRRLRAASGAAYLLFPLRMVIFSSHSRARCGRFPVSRDWLVDQNSFGIRKAGAVSDPD